MGAAPVAGVYEGKVSMPLDGSSMLPMLSKLRVLASGAPAGTCGLTAVSEPKTLAASEPPRFSCTLLLLVITIWLTH